MIAGALACTGGRFGSGRSTRAPESSKPGHRLASAPCRGFDGGERPEPGCEALLYESGGLPVRGFVLRPWPPEPGRRYPAIIFNRGGNEDFGRIDAADLRFFRGFAREGFVVLASQYRGDDGAPGLDEFGGADVEDVLNLFPLARELGGVDLDDVFMLGFSRGGMMTYLAIRDGAPLRAAAVVGGVSNLPALAAYRPEFLRIWKRLIPDFDENSRALMRERSAVLWADRLDKPLLLLHGGADRRVPAEQSRELAEALHRAGRSVELDVFPGDDHMISAHAEARDARIVEWFLAHGAPERSAAGAGPWRPSAESAAGPFAPGDRRSGATPSARAGP
ncbi:MAG TPA: prolyl oligopeptidase family serine peptidase [Thermoanaerobaculia bacterium]|nr:prolyl oligopeptidase family serine peptidase [Thermoanaerobaculia bacterium]